MSMHSKGVCLMAVKSVGDIAMWQGDTAFAKNSDLRSSINERNVPNERSWKENVGNVEAPFSASREKVMLFEDIVVAGTTHVKGIDAIIEDMAFPVTVRLVRNPDNAHDEWAIKVLWGETRIGYIPSGVNEVLARLMDGGRKLKATVRGHELAGNWHKLHMEVALCA